ncbi:ribbon-helix-helix domain-containing protein [Labrys okinawensis]|uniref:ribbon-helix-helix domain-containing protein n=1 Tax=Labrys okinawensis TaxID=346911 RepID=UPI0039BCC32E
MMKKPGKTRVRSVILNGRKSSVSLEDEFWRALKDISRVRGISLQELVSRLDRSRTNINLSSVLRVFVLNVYLGKDGASESN